MRAVVEANELGFGTVANARNIWITFVSDVDEVGPQCAGLAPKSV